MHEARTKHLLPSTCMVHWHLLAVARSPHCVFQRWQHLPSTCISPHLKTLLKSLQLSGAKLYFKGARNPLAIKCLPAFKRQVLPYYIKSLVTRLSSFFYLSGFWQLQQSEGKRKAKQIRENSNIIRVVVTPNFTWWWVFAKNAVTQAPSLTILSQWVWWRPKSGVSDDSSGQFRKHCVYEAYKSTRTASRKCSLFFFYVRHINKQRETARKTTCNVFSQN